MLTLDRGKPIAIVKGGRYDGNIIHLYQEEHDKPCCDECYDDCDGKCCESCHRPRGGCLGCGKKPRPVIEILADIIDDDTLAQFQRTGRLTSRQMAKLTAAIQREQEPQGGEIKEAYADLKTKAKQKMFREIELPDDGVIQPLPSFDEPDRFYVAGQSGSGKSYYLGGMLEQLKKVQPDRPIYLISDVDQDKVLDRHGVIRIKFDEELLNSGKNIKPAKLQGGIAIFDDIDSIPNPKIKKLVETFRDELLRRGRHEGITVFVTNHLITDYKNTRIILNECTAFTIFPRNPAAGNEYLLTKYAGMTKKQAAEILQLPSRWVTVSKNYPMYLMYEKGIKMLGIAPQRSKPILIPKPILKRHAAPREGFED